MKIHIFGRSIVNDHFEDDLVYVCNVKDEEKADQLIKRINEISNISSFGSSFFWKPEIITEVDDIINNYVGIAFRMSVDFFEKDVASWHKSNIYYSNIGKCKELPEAKFVKECCNCVTFYDYAYADTILKQGKDSTNKAVIEKAKKIGIPEGYVYCP